MRERKKLKLGFLRSLETAILYLLRFLFPDSLDFLFFSSWLFSENLLLNHVRIWNLPAKPSKQARPR